MKIFDKIALINPDIKRKTAHAVQVNLNRIKTSSCTVVVLDAIVIAQSRMYHLRTIQVKNHSRVTASMSLPYTCVIHAMHDYVAVATATIMHRMCKGAICWSYTLWLLLSHVISSDKNKGCNLVGPVIRGPTDTLSKSHMQSECPYPLLEER